MPLPTCQCVAGLPIQQQLGNIYCALYTLAQGGGSGDFVTLTGVQTVTNKTLIEPKIDSILDTNGNEILELEPVPNAVNHLALYNSATGTDIILEVEGPDADLGINLTTHGAGKVTVNNMLIQGDLNLSGNLIAPSSDATVGNLNFATVGAGADSPAPDGTYTLVTSITISNGIIIAIS